MREIKILHRKLEIGKILKKYVKNPHFTLEPLMLYKQKQFHPNWKKQTGKARKLQVFIVNQI